jgi:biopolymer transport protein ExbB
MNEVLTAVTELMTRGGPALWLIGVLSVLTLALILWKIWRLMWMGAWGLVPEAALSAWAAGDVEGAEALLTRGHGVRVRIAREAMAARRDDGLNDAAAREETTRLARAELREARAGVRMLELIATIAPLLGLFGTVLGMIEAFQALQSAGARADPGVLAGGIWEALLTTAAGMAVAIPAAMAVTWVDGVVDRAQAEMEDIATRVFTRGPAQGGRRL